jgi:hypothetical protein
LQSPTNGVFIEKIHKKPAISASKEDLMRVWLVLLGVAVVSAPLVPAEQGRSVRRESCVVDNVEEYYTVELDKDYDTRYHAEEIAESLYLGPLMREPDKEGLRSLADIIRKKELELKELQRMVRNHLYGESDEFRELIQKLTEKYKDSREAGFKILDSIYDAFDYDESSPAEEDFDVCLILDRKAHLVVTKVLVDYMERNDLD